ncbi:hypothetical protein RND81_01G046400 [Saponaria officinalis]|uniref:ELM2 domain-containing protein n=1 Tax=Saponaria officinalis TaxID=3572 RepID=A0AAW1NC14_SAPOF
MHKSKKRTPPKKSVNWLKILDDCTPGLVIPVSARFQADVPEWKDPSQEGSSSDESDTLRLLGTTTWPHEDDNAPTEEGDIGKGRPDSCACKSPGSAQCVKVHVSEARKKLQSELGPAFKSWKFDEMGEDVAKSWSSRQKTMFVQLVKSNPLLLQGKSFLMLAEASFTSKTQKDIVSYYLNVHVPKRISTLTRSGCKMLDSDDDEVEGASTARKRSQADHVDVTEFVKSHYLIGRR